MQWYIENFDIKVTVHYFDIEILLTVSIWYDISNIESTYIDPPLR